MRRMDEAETREFLSFGTRTGKLAITRLDGSPMVVPIWFVLDDDGTLLFTTWHESVKARAIQRDGRVSMCVDSEEPPFSYVRVDGSAAVVDDAEQLRAWATRIGGRYMGADVAERFGERNAVPGELLVRLTPTKIVAQADIAA